MIFTGRIDKNKIVLKDREAFAKLIHRLEGKEIEIRLAKHKKQRGLKANAYYWGLVVAPIAQHCGYLPEEAHDALKQKFLTDHSEANLPRVRSTASLNTEEFAAYVENCIQLAAELGIVIEEAA